MEYRDAKKRLEAAYALFADPDISVEKLNSIRALVKGVHSGIDEKLEQCNDAFSRIEKLQEGELVELSAEHLPEKTEEEKKRKKVLLLFIKYWKDLKGEVERVRQEFNAQSSEHNIPQQKSLGKKIFSKIKGPFGIITIAAIGIAATLQATSVQITIKNNGCGTIIPPASLPIPLPGISLPKDPIPNNGSGVLVFPALTVSIDGTKSGILTLGAFKYTSTFEIPNNIRDVTLNGESLLKKNTKVRLGDRKDHTLTFVCSK